MDSKTVLILLASVYVVASLECNTCKDVVDVALCNTTQLCFDGQVCFHNLTRTRNVPLKNLGCMDYQKCGAHGSMQNAIVGRDIHERQISGCFECCSTDQCNRVLCEHLKPSTCVDDGSIDCAKMNTLFNICTDIDNAKKVCPKFCDLCNVVDGNWSEWSSWSQCDVTCENGSQSRSRSCTNPAPQHGGLNCVGNGVEVKTCHLDLCPVHFGWSTWEEWGSCSVSCGNVGLQRRTRNCSNSVPIRNGYPPPPCVKPDLDVRQCMLRPCPINCGKRITGQESGRTGRCSPRPIDGGWSDWSNWSPCSVTCGVGFHSKMRSCTHPSPSYGRDCVGTGIDFDSCATFDCVKSYCMSNPCVNGYCYEVSSDYKCLCTPDYTGRNCNVSLDYCQSNKCVHGACINGYLNYTCLCPGGIYGIYCEVLATDCFDIKNMNAGYTNGVYALWKTHRYLEVLCDMDTAGGGWTVFQNRFNGSVDFYRNFANYTAGFGTMNGEFWLGLDVLHEIVSQGSYELRINITAADGSSGYETFGNFSISAGPNYTLRISRGTGTLGEDLLNHNNTPFSTFDHDMDTVDINCAEMYHGAWWFRNCLGFDLNGKYFTPGTVNSSSMSYYDLKGSYESLKTSKMMLRRV